MSTATIDAPVRDVLVSQPTREIIYYSKRAELQLVREPRYPTYGPGGMKTGQKGGVMIRFEPRPDRQGGMLRLPLEGAVVTAHGNKVAAADIAAWLDEHPLLNDRQEGLWRVEAEPPAVSSDEIARLTQAAMDWDVPTLRAMAEQERAGWDREQVIEIAEGAIVRIEERDAQLSEAEERVAQTEAKAKK